MKFKHIAGVLAILVVLGVAVNTNGNSKKEEVSSIPVFKATDVLQDTLITTVEVDGLVVFQDTVSVYTENMGKVEEVIYKVGDIVNKGDLLITYDTSELDTFNRQLSEAELSLRSAQNTLSGLKIPVEDSQIKQLEAQVSSSEKTILDIETSLNQTMKDLEQAQKDLDNAEILYSSGAISEVEYTSYKTKYDNLEYQKTSTENSRASAEKSLESSVLQLTSAENKVNEASNQNQIAGQEIVVEQAQLKITDLKKDIADFQTKSTAPISGTLLSVDVVDGATVNDGMKVMEIGDTSKLIIEAYVPETDMLGIEVGQHVLIENDNTKEEFESVVSKVYPIAEKIVSGGVEQNAVKIEVELPNELKITAGFSLDLTITTKIDDSALIIPIMSYMTNSDGSAYVYVVKDDNTIEKKSIKIIGFQNSYVSVEGLSNNERILSQPDETVFDGMEVSIEGETITNVGSDDLEGVDDVEDKEE